jgi:integrase
MKTPISSLFRRYIERNGLADSSKAIKGRALRFLIERVGDVPAGQVTREDAEDFRLWLAQGGRGKSSCNIYLSNLLPFFKWCFDERYIETNPFKGIRRYTTERKVRPAFTPVEVQRVVTVADARWRAIVLLSARHSLRRSEILNICRSDIEGKWLHIKAKKKSRDCWQWSIKNHREALILLSEPVLDALTELRPELPAGQPHLLVKPQMYRRLLHLQAENSLTWQLRNCPYGNFSRDFRILLKRASVPHRRFQDLRGLYCQTLLRGGMGIDEVSQLMRHSTVEVTRQFYAKYEPAELAAKSEKIMNQFYASNVR